MNFNDLPALVSSVSCLFLCLVQRADSLTKLKGKRWSSTLDKGLGVDSMKCSVKTRIEISSTLTRIASLLQLSSGWSWELQNTYLEDPRGRICRCRAVLWPPQEASSGVVAAVNSMRLALHRWDESETLASAMSLQIVVAPIWRAAHYPWLWLRRRSFRQCASAIQYLAARKHKKILSLLSCVNYKSSDLEKKFRVLCLVTSNELVKWPRVKYRSDLEWTSEPLAALDSK